MATKDFYLPISFEVEIRGVDVYPYHLSLNPVTGWEQKVIIVEETQQGRGHLIIVKEKNNYKVIFEDREIVPPFVLKNVPAGKYRIKVISPDLEKNLDITVKEGKANLVDIDEKL